MGRMIRMVAVLALAAGALGACGDDDPAVDTDDANATTTTAAAAGSPKVSATEYSFTTPAQIAGGTVAIEFTNTGKESHAFNMVRLTEGKTVGDLVTTFSAQQDGPPPAWMNASGGTALAPGASTTYTGTLEAGSYAFYCPIPGPDGAPHFTKGMVAPFTVTAGETAELPEADVTITGSEYKFDGLTGLKAGDQTFEFTNGGKENHEAAVAELAPGKTAEDLKKFLSSEGAPSGPPPFVAFPGLVLELKPGQSATARFSPKAGTTYVFLCFIGNQKGPHFLQGMLQEVKIT